VCFEIGISQPAKKEARARERTDDMKSLVNNFKLWFLCVEVLLREIIVLFSLSRLLFLVVLIVCNFISLLLIRAFVLGREEKVCSFLAIEFLCVCFIEEISFHNSMRVNGRDFFSYFSLKSGQLWLSWLPSRAAN
jgi:hypothetical protein